MKRYIRTAESELSTPTGNVGIWWFYDNTVEKYSCPIAEGYSKDGYIEFIPQMKSDLPRAESGEVVYDIRSQVFEIICSQEIAKNENAIKLIAKEFDISDQRYDVIPSSHYVPKTDNKPVMNASRQRGYDTAMLYIRKYAKAMKVLGR